jgi:Transposase DDE domain group 1
MTSRVLAIACGHEDAIDLDRLRHDPLMKLAAGRCPESGAALASQSTISRLQNEPSKIEAARLAAGLLDQFGTTVKPGRLEILYIDDTFCAAHGGQQLAFWNAHHDERGFASMHIYHVTSGTPVVAILRPAPHPEGHRGEDRHQAHDETPENALAEHPHPRCGRGPCRPSRPVRPRRTALFRNSF